MHIVVYYLIEFLDELVFGVLDSAWPLIQEELNLNYTQIGILLTVPGIISVILEPILGILGDTWKRRAIILTGGIFFSIALFLTLLSSSFYMLLIAMILFYPASGAFVSLSQASLMDADPSRHDQNMARWTLAGSLGVVFGPVLLIGFSAIGFGWRGVFLALTFLAVVMLSLAARKLPKDAEQRPALSAFKLLSTGFRGVIDSLKLPGVLRWLILLVFSDLMLDILLAFLALYFHDVAGLSEAEAAGAVLIWLVVGFIGDLLLIPVLEKIDGLRYLRISVTIELVLFPIFLLIPYVPGKLILVAFLGLFNSGWYAILKGRLYSAMPGRSGTVMAVESIFGMVGGFMPLAIGVLADSLGLRTAIWLMLAGPIALSIGLPKKSLSR